MLQIENENLGLCNLTSSGLSLAYFNGTSRLGLMEFCTSELLQFDVHVGPLLGVNHAAQLIH